jgi:hypothetical protein
LVAEFANQVAATLTVPANLSELTQLARTLNAAATSPTAAALGDVDGLFSRLDSLSARLASAAQAGTRPGEPLAPLPADMAALLAAGSAAAASGSHPYRGLAAVPVPLRDRASDTASLAPFALAVFDEWVTHFWHTTANAAPNTPPSATAALLGAQLPSSAPQDVMAAVGSWHVPLDSSRSPAELLADNWAQAAKEALTDAVASWEAHARWVFSAPDSPCWLLLSDPRSQPLSRLAHLDRHRLLGQVAARYSARGTGHDRLWALRVPAVAARALHGWSAPAGDGGHVEVASLEILGDAPFEQVCEVAAAVAVLSPSGLFSDRVSASANCLI